MALSTKQSWTVVEPGIIIASAEIIDAISLSGTQPTNFKEVIDIGLQLNLKKDGLDRPIELKLFGRAKRNDTGEVKGWGSALNVMFALKSLLGRDVTLEEDNSIPSSVLAELPGKQIYTLSYMSTAGKWYSWKEVAPQTDAGMKMLLARFKDSLRRGYPQDFAPQAGRVAPAGNTDFPGHEADGGSW